MPSRCAWVAATRRSTMLWWSVASSKSTAVSAGDSLSSGDCHWGSSATTSMPMGPRRSASPVLSAKSRRRRSCPGTSSSRARNVANESPSLTLDKATASVVTASRVCARSAGVCANQSSSIRPCRISATKCASSDARLCSSGLPCEPSRSVIWRGSYHSTSILSIVDVARRGLIAIAPLTTIPDVGIR